MNAPVEKIHALLDAVRAHDGVEALSEQFVRGLSDTRLGHTHFLRERAGDVIAVLAFDGESAELAVHPDHRRQGVAASLLADAASALSAPQLKVWAHGNLPAARELAASLGAQAERTLLVMAVGGEALDAAIGSAAVELPDGMVATNYADAVERFGADAIDAAWVKANNEAFSWHPEQGGWDVARLRRGMEAEWFDPRGVVLFLDSTSFVDDAVNAGVRVAGFHWTKWHGPVEVSRELGASRLVTGEVYVVGLADAYRGRGLGAPLLREGLRFLHEKGAQRVILYVEADNEPAVAAYEKLGFGVAEEHVVYRVNSM